MGFNWASGRFGQGQAHIDGVLAVLLQGLGGLGWHEALLAPEGRGILHRHQSGMLVTLIAGEGECCLQQPLAADAAWLPGRANGFCYLNDVVLGIKVLQRADASFQRKEGQNETAINAKGFEVDFLRRMQEGDDPHPFKLSDAEDELWPVMAERAKILTEAPRFSHVVIGATGKMAVMHTISPVTFVEFKRWLADRQNREPSKRRRDALQAQTVQGLMDEGLLLAP